MRVMRIGSGKIQRLALVGVTMIASPVFADSHPDHQQANSEKPQAWPGGIIPYDISKLTPEQQTKALQAMKRWTDTGANIQFVPYTNQAEYVYFTGKTDAGNNTTHTGFKQGSRSGINITAFWWRQAEWMPAHELGHVLGFQHEHQRWDRDAHITVNYENIKSGRAHDYDYRSIMHYRVCWTSAKESECRDGDGRSPSAVIDPVGADNDKVIGQWDANGISQTDGEELRLIYGTKPAAKPAGP